MADSFSTDSHSSGGLVSDNRTGILLVGHGTRSELGTAQFLALADYLSSSFSPAAIAPAFLELQPPDIDAAIGRLVARGTERLVTVPLLLFTAGHAKQDIPQAVEAALARHQAAHLPHWQTAPFVCHEALVRLSNLRLQEAAGASRALPPGNELPLCVVVGRGSRDRLATAEMHAFVRCKAALMDAMRFEVAFAALAEPRLSEVLRQAVDRGVTGGPTQIIVQPHLLFAGEIVDRIERQTAAAAAEWPRVEWLVSPVLAGRTTADSTHFPHLEQAIRDAIVAAVSKNPPKPPDPSARLG